MAPDVQTDSQAGGDKVNELQDSEDGDLLAASTRMQHLYMFLEEPSSSRAALSWSHFVLYVIVASIACFVLATLPEFRDFQVWEMVEIGSTVIFTVEYVLRLAAADAFACQTRLDFARNPLNVLDLLAILPFYFELILEKALENIDTISAFRVLRAVRLIRCFRVFKLSKYSAGMNLMIGSLVNSMRPLTILMFFLCIGVILSSSLIYFAERSYCPDVDEIRRSGQWSSYRQECADAAGETRDGTLCCNEYGSADNFESIASTFWWSMVTMTTVGYGDVVPQTPLGKVVACLAMLAGIVLISLPVAIVGTKFHQAYEEYELDMARKILIGGDEGVLHVAKESTHGKARGTFGKVVNAFSSQEEMRRLARQAHSGDDAALRDGVPCSGEATRGVVAPRDCEVPPGPLDEAVADAGDATESVQAEASKQSDAFQSSHSFHPSLSCITSAKQSLGGMRVHLRRLEKAPELSREGQKQVQLLLELFDHIEGVEKQLGLVHEKDVALDACIRKDFISLSRAYDEEYFIKDGVAEEDEAERTPS